MEDTTDHIKAVTLVHKVLITGYYWTTLRKKA